jgi:hypothetical protein
MRLRERFSQLSVFASLGSWVSARIDCSDPARKPLAKPGVRSWLRPLGPVAVSGASNFPLAFFVAGGDTACALAAGNAVMVRANPTHPGTSELVTNAISPVQYAALTLNGQLTATVHAEEDDVKEFSALLATFENGPRQTLSRHYRHSLDLEWAQCQPSGLPGPSLINTSPLLHFHANSKW